ncbi:MAG: hypothetical protein Q4E45_01315 [Eubacteriales bacterium]|nr:hypothetical protein [Eubacteriales bacterium]
MATMAPTVSSWSRLYFGMSASLRGLSALTLYVVCLEDAVGDRALPGGFPIEADGLLLGDEGLAVEQINAGVVKLYHGCLLFDSESAERNRSNPAPPGLFSVLLILRYQTPAEI